MSMYIKNDDLEFLKQVHKDLDDVAEYVDDSKRLFNLIQILQERRYRDRQKKNGKCCLGEKSQNPEYKEMR